MKAIGTGSKKPSASIRAGRQRELGDDQQWQQYRSRFEEVLRTAIDDGVIPDRREMGKVFHSLQTNGYTYLDGDGQPWLEEKTSGQLRRVGLSEDNVFSAGSDSTLAMQVLLARTYALLLVGSNHRELWPEFEADWALLQRAEEAMPGSRTHTVIAARAGRQ